MSKRDYYEVLDVARTASETEIKSAYRKMAMKYHPDRNPGDKKAEECFKEAAEAYAILSDVDKRGRYDQFGHAGVQNGAGGFDPSRFTDFADIFGDLGGFGDLFSEVFGGGTNRRRTRAQRGSDLRYDLRLSFKEAAFGTKTKIKIPRLENCSSCGGTGAGRGSGPVTCPTCHGRGQMRYQQGFFTISRTCSHCQGAGRVIKDPCKECYGEGQVRREKTLELKIPAGVDNGQRLRVQGEGEGGPNGGPAGDLYVILYVEDHPFFQRQESHLLCQIPVTLTQAVLGTELRVPTLEGEATLKIPAATQSGAVLRLRGKGLASLDGRHGDLIVTINVVIPTNLNKEQRRLFEELARLDKEEACRQEKSLFEKVKNLFE
ncbi:MAG: molecular chaperone DnaJ [Acidobacteria bacterium]|nr:molecular chaperone DnaJ [Acidobacteriota bacterium]MBI3655670.1 molecular chaperone DnaJ [Acidobacteriota bacterium]